MFFSVDVESGNTRQIPGALLSIGAVAITEDTLQVVDKFYCNLAYDEKTFDEETIQWWESEEDPKMEEVKVQAFAWDQNRLHPVAAAIQFAEWVKKCTPENESAFFVANPVSFDSAWINLLFTTWGIESPFHYRTLCLRSMLFGITGGNFGGSREATANYPTLAPTSIAKPHHALYDAEAQGQDLINMMNYLRRGTDA